MARSYDKTRLNGFWVVVITLIALLAGVFIFWELINTSLGTFHIRETREVAFGNRSNQRVALLDSDYTRAAHRTNTDTDATWVDVTLESWEAFLQDPTRRLDYTIISDAELEGDVLEDFDILVLASARALSDAQIARVQQFMDGGGSVLATWTPGLYYPDGRWRGWSFVEDTFGVRFVDFIGRNTGQYQVYRDTFPGNTPAGLYRPDRFFDREQARRDSLGLDAELDPSERTLRIDRQAEAARADFAPLRGYRWASPLEQVAPRADYARADTVTALLRDMDGTLRMQPGVDVTYATWVGGDAGPRRPYPYTGPGIRRFTMLGNTPLTAEMHSGYRVKVQVYNAAVQMDVEDESRTRPLGYWFDFAEEDLVTPSQLGSSTGAVYGTYGKGRFIYLGFQRDAMGIGPEDAEDQEVLAVFFGNVVNYLRRSPVAWVQDWPVGPDGSYAAAAVLGGLAERNVGYLQGAQQVLDDFDAPGTYFVEPDRAAGFGDLLRRLHTQGDVGVLSRYRTTDDGDREAQARALSAAKRSLDAVVGEVRPVTGYHAETRGDLSRTTLGALVDADYRYFLPDSIGRRMVPKIMGEPYEILTRINVTARSDEDILGALQDEGDTTVRAALFKQDIQRVLREEGMYVLTYSSDLLGADTATLREIVSTLRENDFWIASGAEVRAWWRMHNGLNTEVERRSDNRIVVRVANGNAEVATGLGVRVALGRAITGYEIRPEVVDVTSPDFPRVQRLRRDARLLAGGTVLFLPVENLEPQETRVYHIDLKYDEGRVAEARR